MKLNEKGIWLPQEIEEVLCLVTEAQLQQAVEEAKAAKDAEIAELRAKLSIAVVALMEARGRFDCLQDYESTGTFMARTGYREIEKALATIKGDQQGNA